MFLSFVLLTCYLQISKVYSQELSVVRHLDGDIFTVEGSCSTACSDVSSFTATPYRRQSSSNNGAVGLSSSVNSSCICQCNPTLPLFREDLHICVSDLHECSVTGFLSSSGVIEKIPYIFLPQQGQIIYPQAEVQFHGVITPVCGIAGAQQLGKSGWSELRNLSSTESPFKLFKDEGRTFLQWIGEGGLRDAAEGKVVIVRLVCRDASLQSSNRSVFMPCVAFRVAGSPSKSNIREVTFVSTVQSQQGLSTIEYTAIGISSVLLALIYIASVSLYLHSRRVRRKLMKDAEFVITNGRDGTGLIKNNPLLAASRHFETDSNSVRSESDRGEEFDQSDGEQNGFEKITSAIVHPHVMYIEQCESAFGSPIIAERLPEENVRIVETIENAHQQDIAMLPGIQRRKLYFNPAYFDRQLLLAPPPAAIEFLFKIREVISIAKHKLAAKRFIPTLSGIPEEEITSERCSTSNKRAGSIQSSVAKSKKSQRCTGCPGCLESRPNNLPIPLPDNSRPIPGESRVRAWLEDIKPPERRWRDSEDSQKNFQENVRTFARNLEHLKDIKGDFLQSHQTNGGGKSLASWKDNPPMLRTFQNIAKSEILGDDDRHSISRKSTKSMFEDTNYDRFCRTRRCNLEMTSIELDDTINAKVRKAIENSFIKQMEENAALENQMIESNRNQNEQRFSPDGSSEKTNLESLNSAKKSPDTMQKRRIYRAAVSLTKELPDMINELPTSKLHAKKIMDAVIKEMVDVKALEHHGKETEVDYEIDSLERTNRRKLEKRLNDASLTLAKQNELMTLKNSNVNTEMDDEILRKNYYNNLPELISQRSEGYSLVSEVYVNDGYASPANSDDSGPEICYKSENPGHLMIKVQDSPENYIKQDESEYEPDTLDRKPMKLKINGDVCYEKSPSNEIYVDSLERPAHILLKSKGSFRDDTSPNNNNTSLSRGYGSLREIYEAKLRSNVDSNLMDSMGSLNDNIEDNLSWKHAKYLTPDTRHVRRQRKLGQPDVVPLPPAENIYQQPKPPRTVEESKNERDRRLAETGNPTASECSPVHNKRHVGIRKNNENYVKNHVKKSNVNLNKKIEDSGYLSSTDSSGSNKQLIKYEFGSVSETDETESICDGASESGAESVGTDSVFFGNFRKLSNISQFSKSVDSGVDIGINNSCFISTKLERHMGINSSDSENESFVTVLPFSTKCRNKTAIS